MVDLSRRFWVMSCIITFADHLFEQMIAFYGNKKDLLQISIGNCSFISQIVWRQSKMI